MYEKYNKECDRVYNQTILRKSSDFNWVNDFLISILKNHIKEES